MHAFVKLTDFFVILWDGGQLARSGLRDQDAVTFKSHVKMICDSVGKRGPRDWLKDDMRHTEPGGPGSEMGL